MRAATHTTGPEWTRRVAARRSPIPGPYEELWTPSRPPGPALHIRLIRCLCAPVSCLHARSTVSVDAEDVGRADSGRRRNALRSPTRAPPSTQAPRLSKATACETGERGRNGHLAHGMHRWAEAMQDRPSSVQVRHDAWRCQLSAAVTPSLAAPARRHDEPLC